MKTLTSATMPPGKRLNIYFTDLDDLELYAQIEAIAKDEKRSMSQMMKMLAASAIAKQKRIKAEEEND
ncbi:MAG: hypothetical protein DSM106950_12655 [Stigonema ocellatum SAG 48.90 = DSM 106950]|nr:hypothetical protein [Stigonema ocellatum SAG 48.90 = DSM 106950]